MLRFRFIKSLRSYVRSDWPRRVLARESVNVVV